MKAGGAERETDFSTNGVCFELEETEYLYTISLKLIDSRGHVTVDTQKRPNLSHHRSCLSLAAYFNSHRASGQQT
jgi:hypothetical protein